MLFDDRLATVLRLPAQSEAGVRTQYRQLLDLLGTAAAGEKGPLVDAAYARLAELAAEIPASAQSAILRAPGLRLRSRDLVAFLAQSEPQAAAAAMATAQLEDGDWCDLIPQVPMTARGFLRHRRDLPPGARRMLDRLGVGDLVLPEPASLKHEPDDEGPRDRGGSSISEKTGADDDQAEDGIGALVRRIEAFRKARREATHTPQLPLEDGRAPEHRPAHAAFDFATDTEGVVTWADPAIAPLMVGMTLTTPFEGSLAAMEDETAHGFAHQLPVRGARIVLAGPAEMAGAWRIDAAPAFSQPGGRFAGYRGRLRRIIPRSKSARAERDRDLIRQTLHELRTPVGAIQGFAELIQQQLFGPVPNEYRALAAAVAVDAARLLAGFDEIDRLARLEAGAMMLDEGQGDLRRVVETTLRRLEASLRQRSARIDFFSDEGAFAVGIAEQELQRLVWRLLATLAGALAPGEIIDAQLGNHEGRAVLTLDVPASLGAGDDPFGAAVPDQPGAITASMFGAGFALRLARTEVTAAGGSFDHEEDRLKVTLPLQENGEPRDGRRADSDVAA